MECPPVGLLAGGARIFADRPRLGRRPEFRRAWIERSGLARYARSSPLVGLAEAGQRAGAKQFLPHLVIVGITAGVQRPS